VDNKSVLVTAFFDIGRAQWENVSKSFSRSNDTYIKRFLRITRLKNDIIVFGTPEFLKILKEIVGDRKLNIFFRPFETSPLLDQELLQIENIQTSDSFISRVKESQKSSPEYWNNRYVLVTNLKIHFLWLAKQEFSYDTFAWIDFGYARKYSSIPVNFNWIPKPSIYNFNKIHLMALKPYDGKPLHNCILENDVYISGELIIVPEEKVDFMQKIFTNSKNRLRSENIVDDDQGLLLDSYITNPEAFEMVKIPDWQTELNADTFSSLLRTNLLGDKRVSTFHGMFLSFLDLIRFKLYEWKKSDERH
jgi:protein YibB